MHIFLYVKHTFFLISFNAKIGPCVEKHYLIDMCAEKHYTIGPAEKNIT